VELSKESSPIPLFRLGWAYIRNNNIIKGIECLEDALKIDPNHAEILNKLGESLIQVEKEANFERAKQLIQRSIKLDPTSSEAYTNLGRIYRK